MQRPVGILYLMAKKPQSGQVKTRLAAELGGDQAAQVAALMLEHTAHKAASAWPGAIALAVSPDPHSDLFTAICARYGWPCCVQSQGDLGQRISALLQQGVMSYGAAAVIGSDMPHMDPQVFKQAADMQIRGVSSIAPTVDGGFYLLSVCHHKAQMFHGVRWSSEHTFQDTIRACARVDIALQTPLPSNFDIDTLADLKRLAQLDPAYAAFLS